ncbi:MAG: helix-turn-helix transcriptional regulator [Gammaproteobacteria bacterium]|nr:helix-turn-helix transcriptional regulator [Gammaproteobacteria bacterium]
MPARNPKITEEAARRLQVLGERIRARRKHLEVSATVAAEAAGMSRITWYRIEKGEPSVTMGAWINAATAVGLTLGITEPGAERAIQEGWLPARVRLADYPQLRKLAWHVREVDTLSASEAMDIYERNQRHLDHEAMTQDEMQLLDALCQAFGKTTPGND